jgi:hypothetical protein
LVTAFNRPSSIPRLPGSSLAIAQVAGQNAARARTSPTCPAASIQKPSASMNHSAESTTSQHEASMMRRPPTRSV